MMRIATCAVLAGLAACSDSSASIDAGPTTDAPPAADAGPTDYRPNFVGHVRVMEGASGTEQEFFSIRAFLTDKGFLPAGQLVASDGDCAVYVHPERGDCTPACAGEYCNASDQCEPFPSPRSAGVITVTGLAEPLAFTPTAGGYDAPFLDVDLFDPGDPITITAAGDDVAGFSADFTGLPALETTLSGLTLEPGVDRAITWTAENAGRIQLALVVGHHLAPYESMLLCETDDDGELIISGELVSRLPYQKTFLENHVSTMARFERQVVDTSLGPVELIVGSQRTVGFSHYPPQ